MKRTRRPSANDYLKYIPDPGDVTFVPRKESPAPTDLAQFRRAIFAGHHHADGKYRDGGVPQLKEDSAIYKSFRERLYHKVLYRRYGQIRAGLDYIPVPHAIQDEVSKQCSVLADHFPAGRYMPGWSIVDESTIFYEVDGSGHLHEIACYDRDIRSPASSRRCAREILRTTIACRRPTEDEKRHESSTTSPMDSDDEEEAAHIETSIIRRGVKHAAWAWVPSFDDQGPVVSKDLLDPEFQTMWLGPLGRELQPLFAQASTVVYTRDAKDWGQCWQAVSKAAGRFGTNAMSSLCPLTQIPFNGCALVILEDTSDHKDSMNMPGRYGTTQPLGKYPLGEGSMTLLQLGVVLLYRPTDTLCADFLLLSHFTKPLTKGYRYCLTSFMHRKIYNFRRDEGAVKKEETGRRRFLGKKQDIDWNAMMRKAEGRN